MKPRMSSRWPLNSCFTRTMTPWVSILRGGAGAADRLGWALQVDPPPLLLPPFLPPHRCALNSFMISRKVS